jgi:ribose 5-phosphate isomerase A
MSDKAKKNAALAAADLIKPGVKLGLGTGTTVAYFIEALGQKIKAGLDIKCVPTSKASHALAVKHGLPMITLEQEPFLDLTVDGADEFDSEFNLIKGGGGALLFEKIVATSSKRMLVIADESKRVDKIGKFPLPIEVIPFGWKATGWKIDKAFKLLKIDAKMKLRMKDGKPFTTDAGHFIIDCAMKGDLDPRRAESIICCLPGVVDTGIFIGVCGRVLMGTDKGVETLDRV